MRTVLLSAWQSAVNTLQPTAAPSTVHISVSINHVLMNLRAFSVWKVMKAQNYGFVQLCTH